MADAAATTRSYGQYCPLARALDLLGDRWTLLVVRDLLFGPKRFTDLVEGLPGIGTNLLSARIKRLEAAGIVARTRLRPPASSVVVYELTDLGRELEPAIFALGRFGSRIIGAPRRGDVFRPGWLVLGMRVVFHPEAAEGLRETYEFRIDGEIFHVRVEDGTATTREGHAERPDVVMTTDTKTLLGVVSRQITAGAAVRSGRLSVGGDPNAMKRLGELFVLRADSPRPEPSTTR